MNRPILLLAAAFVFLANLSFAVTISVTDDSLEGNEGSNVTTSMTLSGAPASNTTFTLAAVGVSTSITLATTEYYFTTATFATAQPITFALVDCAGYFDNSATWTIVPTEGDTTIATKTITIRNKNTDAYANILLTDSALVGNEGTNKTTLMTLAYPPNETTAFTFAAVGASTSITLASKVYTFTRANYAAPQTVSFVLVDCAGYFDNSATWRITPTSGDTAITVKDLTIRNKNVDEYSSIVPTASIVDNEAKIVGYEGSRTTATVDLRYRPNENTTFTVSAHTDDPEITVDIGEYYFTTVNYGTAQNILFDFAVNPLQEDDLAVYDMEATEGDLSIATQRFEVRSKNLDPYDGLEMDTLYPTADENNTVGAHVWLNQRPSMDTTFTLAAVVNNTNITMATTEYMIPAATYDTSVTLAWTLANVPGSTVDQVATWSMTPTEGDTAINATTFVVRSINTNPVSDADLDFSDTTPTVIEGGTVSITAVLDAAPWIKTGATVVDTTFAVARSSGSTLVTCSPATLLFNPTNFATSQTITFTAARDRYTYDNTSTTFGVTATIGDVSISAGEIVVTYTNSGFFGDTTSIAPYTLTYSEPTLDMLDSPSTGVVATFKFTGNYSPKKWFRIDNVDTTYTAHVFLNDPSGEFVSNFGGDIEIVGGSYYIVTEATGLMPPMGISSLSMYLDDKTTPTLRVRAH